MGRIVKIASQKGHKDDCIIYMDDGTNFSLNKELLIKYGLKEGTEIDQGKLKNWLDEDGVKKAYNAALRYLGFRSRSSKEVEDYLRKKGFGDGTIRDAVQKLKGYGLIDDKAFARDWVSSRMQAGARGRLAIAYELRQKGIDGEIIEEVVGSITDEEEEEQAFKLANKYYERYKGLEKKEMVIKTGQALARRGFSWEIIQRVVERWM
ncbi:MAG: hypothetical protein GX094_05755 [Clostridiales bacterium]|jgi:regulatory protein|nr:hypothetical protein [Clostridiales bacterium]